MSGFSEFCMNFITHMHHTAESPFPRQGWPCVEYLSECFYSLVSGQRGSHKLQWMVAVRDIPHRLASITQIP